MRAAVFLDRDGVINKAPVHAGVPTAPTALADVELLPGVPEALQALREAGYLLIVATNQPDVARGRCDRAAVEAIHDHLRAVLSLDEIRACFHDDVDACGCRKPAPGLLLEAAERLGISLSASWMVGDRWRDIEAGRQAGVRTLFVDHGYDEALPNPPDHRVTSLREAAAVILGDAS